ncbi:MAG TPA: type II secretion system protein [Candidatus Paceibacterota bacterium]|nr:type II secretion system protein [Candidatus Paceibacterota bacterium]
MINFSFKKFIKKGGWSGFQKGMTYVELIVVLSIFATMTSIVMFNYGDFQQKIYIRNLTSEIALKIVEAQKDAMSGKKPPQYTPPGWRPAYGVSFGSYAYLGASEGTMDMVYYADLDKNNDFSDGYCRLPPVNSAECMDMLTLTNGNRISNLEVFPNGLGTSVSVENLSITFERPYSRAVFASSYGGDPAFVEITIVSPNGISGKIRVHATGRIEI